MFVEVIRFFSGGRFVIRLCCVVLLVRLVICVLLSGEGCRLERIMLWFCLCRSCVVVSFSLFVVFVIRIGGVMGYVNIFWELLGYMNCG